MDATQSQIKIHDMSPEEVSDFAFDHDVESHDLFTELVPNLDNWGSVGWMELTDSEYDAGRRIFNLTVETKWAAPTEWLRNATTSTHYLENKLVTMTTIQKDERLVGGVAAMDGEILQNKVLLEFDSDQVGRHYDNEQPQYDLDQLDNTIWDSIAKFVTVCEQFYLEREQKND